MSDQSYTSGPLVAGAFGPGTISSQRVGSGHYGVIGIATQRDPHPIFGGGVSRETSNANARLWAAAPTLVGLLCRAIEASGFSLSGPTDLRAAENEEPAWICNARLVIARIPAGHSGAIIHPEERLWTAAAPGLIPGPITFDQVAHLLADVLPYATSRAEDLLAAKAAGNEDPTCPGADEAAAKIEAASAVLEALGIQTT